MQILAPFNKKTRDHNKNRSCTKDRHGNVPLADPPWAMQWLQHCWTGRSRHLRIMSRHFIWNGRGKIILKWRSLPEAIIALIPKECWPQNGDPLARFPHWATTDQQLPTTFVLLPPPLPLIFLIWTMHHVRHLFVCRAVNFMIQGRKKLRNEVQMKMRAVFILIKIGEAQLPSNSLPLALGSDLKRQQRAAGKQWIAIAGSDLGMTKMVEHWGDCNTHLYMTKTVTIKHQTIKQRWWDTATHISNIGIQGQLQHLYRLAGRNSFHLCLCLHLLIGFSILLWLTCMIIVCCASVKKRWVWKFLHIGATRLTFAKKPDRKVARGVGCLFNQNALS